MTRQAQKTHPRTLIARATGFAGAAVRALVCIAPLNSRRFSVMMGVSAMGYAIASRHKIAHILAYKGALQDPQHRWLFLFKYFVCRSHAAAFTLLLAADPQKYMNYVKVEGEEYVQQLRDRPVGVILISGHFGPMMQTLIFRERLKIAISSFTTADNKEELRESSAPKYSVTISVPAPGKYSSIIRSARTSRSRPGCN